MLAAALALALSSVPVAQDLASGPASPAIPALTSDTFAAWRKHIRPKPKELYFERIPWHPTFADGVKAANDARAPLLFWAMNGHPLGCT